MTKVKGEDRRIKYTKYVLKESLIKLLRDKPIEKVTIKELCVAADINRSTFYVHFSDQYNLMKQIETEFLDDIYNYLESFDFKENAEEAYEMLVKIFEYIVENSEVCKVLLGVHGDKDLQKRVMMLAQQQSMRDWRGKKPIDGEMHEYIMLFGVNGSIGVVQKWLQEGLSRSPREMAEIVIKLIYNGLSAYI